MAPQPIRVGDTGMFSSSASSTSFPEALALITPPPAMMIGLVPLVSRSTIFSAWPRVALGFSTGSGS